MYRMYPIYIPSAEYAREHDEIELWRESHKINMECKTFMADNASRSFHDRRLREFVKELTDTFGLERAMYVSARTINYKEWDGRFHSAVKERASAFAYEDSNTSAVKEDNYSGYSIYDHSSKYISDIHPAIFNEVFRCLMKMEQEQINLPIADVSQESERSEGVDR